MELNDGPTVEQARALVLNHTLSYINSMSLKCAIELGIFDIIHENGSSVTLPNLVSALAIPEGRTGGLRRLMRILTHSGFFSLRTEHMDGGEGECQNSREAYVLTTASQFLLKGKPSNISMCPLVEFLVHPNIVQPFNELSKWFRNDSHLTSYEIQHGKGLWDYCAHDPSFNTVLNEGMGSDSLVLKSKIIEKCKRSFEHPTSLVDVAGGTGLLARGIADMFPHLEVTVLDLPHVVCGLEGTKNLKFMAGDMFESVPRTNMILLKCILHDWNDEECVKILKRCKEAISGNGKDGGKVIVIDIVVEDHKDNVGWSETDLLFDTLMMVILTGKERSRKEWAKLFVDSGFSKYEITPLDGSRCIIEVYP